MIEIIKRKRYTISCEILKLITANALSFTFVNPSEALLTFFNVFGVKVVDGV